MRHMKLAALFFVFFYFVLKGQTGYNELKCYVSEEGMQFSKTNSATLITGTTNLALLLCVEQGQDRVIPINQFISVLSQRIPDYFERTSFGNYHVNVIDVLVDSVDEATNRAFAYELPGMLVPEPPIDSSFVASPWMVRDILAQADEDYNFSNFDADDNGIVDFLAFFVIRFSSGWACGTTGLSINSLYTTNDTTDTGTFVQIDGRGYLSLAGRSAIIQRNNTTNADHIVAVSVHELGHSLFSFLDMDHSGGRNYDHYALGHFCAMSQSIGFNGRPSPYNPVFCVQRDWLTPTLLTAGTKTFTDFKNTGLIYEYDVSNSSPASSDQKFYLTYHTNSVNNYWEGAWPIPQDAQGNKKGVMVWHNAPNGRYSNKYLMPVDIVAAHGKWQWDLSAAVLDSNNVPLTEAVNSGIPNPIKGLDSLEARYSYIKFRWSTANHTWLAEPVYPDYRIGSASCFFDPLHPKNFAFYTNPNSNGAINQSSQNYSRTFAQTFKMSNMQLSGNNTSAEIYIGADANIISENTTLNTGKWYFNNNVTVAPGATLTVQAGTELVFDNGASLIVSSYGMLTANGTAASPITFDFVSPNATTQNGIKFTTNISMGNINYCQIRNAYRGIYENGVSIGIYNTAISGCTDGIYLYSSNPTIQDCNIHNNTTGISLLYSSPVIKENYIQNNNAGIYCSSHSNPKIGNPSTQIGNQISGNSYGVIIFNNALPIVGNSTYGGYNNLVNSCYNLLNTTQGYVYAQNNWWGSSNPANFLICGGPVSYSPYRTSSVNVPQPALSKISGGNPEPVKEKEVPMAAELDKAYSLAYSGSIDEARAICLNLVNNYPDYAVSYNALNLLKETYTENELTSKENAYKSIFNSKSKKDLYALAGLMLADLDKANKLKQIDEVIENYKGESIVELALFDKLVYYAFELQDNEKARAISNELDKQFPNSQGAIEAHKILGDEKYFGKIAMQKDNSQIVEETPAEFGLFDNYPNPFNPTTTINYSLPYQSAVNLVIYDIMGREVKSFEVNSQSAGTHSILWDGRNANGVSVSSGMYLYRISIKSLENSEEFVKTAKMVLLK